MRGTHTLVVLIGLALLPAGPAGTQKPNFSGTWVTVSPAEFAGQEQVITHDLQANTLTLQHGAEGGHHQRTHTLDGAESRNALSSHGGQIVTLSRASWTGNQITIVNVSTYPDGTRRESKELWSLDAAGQLVLDLTEVADALPKTTRIVHKKK